MKNLGRNLIHANNHKGYMLIEALIAIGIFSIGFLAVANLVLITTQNNINGNILTEANILARQTLEQLKNTPDIKDLPKELTVNTESGLKANGEAGGIYTRTTKIEDVLGFNTSRAIEVTVSWSWRGKDRSIMMNTITKGKGI